MYQINDDVIYTFIKSGAIEKVHYDDPPDLYYTVKLNNTNKEGIVVSIDRLVQTTEENIYLVEKVSQDIPGPARTCLQNTQHFDKGDKVIYVKKVNTKIYDIDTTKEPLYKIQFNNIYKYVNNKRLKKL